MGSWNVPIHVISRHTTIQNGDPLQQRARAPIWMYKQYGSRALRARCGLRNAVDQGGRDGVAAVRRVPPPKSRRDKGH